MSDEEHDDQTGDDGATDEGGFDPAALAAKVSSEAAGGDDQAWERVGEDDAGAGTSAFDFPSFDESAPVSPTGDLAMLDDVSLKVTVELGRTRMFVEDVLRLVPEAVIELDKAAGDPVDVFVNGRHVARGEVLVLNENFCVRINEIISASDEDD